MRPNTVVLGNLSRSVRDAARYYDVCAGSTPTTPPACPRPAAGRRASAPTTSPGKRVAIVPNLGGVTLEPGVEDRIRAEAAALIADTGMVQVDFDIDPPNLAAQWMMGNLATLLADLGDRWPGCADDLTDEVAIGLRLVAVDVQPPHRGRGRGAAHRGQRGHGRGPSTRSTSSSPPPTPAPPSPADADHAQPDRQLPRVGPDQPVAKLRVPRRCSARCGWPSAFAPSCPSALLDLASEAVPRPGQHGRAHDHLEHLRQPGRVDPRRHRRRPAGRHAGAGRHHEDALLFDVALAVERERPWPLVAPSSARCDHRG